jgi:ABC-type multidrug transport system fused ATPase/permease subunit
MLHIAVASALGLVTPYLLKLVVDEVVGAGRATWLWPVVGVGVVVFALKSWTRYRGKWGAQKVAQNEWLRMRNRVFEHLQGLSLTYHASADVGDHVSRVQYDTYALKNLWESVVPSGVQFVVGMGGTAVILLALAPRLTLLAFVALPLAVLVGWIFRDKVYPLSRSIAEYRGDVYSSVYEGLSNVEDVKTYGGEGEFERRVEEAGEDLREAELELAHHRARLFPLVNFGIALVLLGTLGVGGQMVLEGAMSVGTLVAFYFYVSRSLGPMRRAPNIVFGWYRAKAAHDRLDELMDLEIAIDEPDEPLEVPAGVPRVGFRDVEFTYETPEPIRREDAPEAPDDEVLADRGRRATTALDGVSFELGPGDRCVILGPSGSGKSTTGKLVARLFDPQGGAITAESTPLTRFDVEAWRSKIGFVGQEVGLIRGTIEENIVFGRESVAEEDLERALQVAAVDEILGRKMDGLETEVGEQGAKLSGGQRKRIALARALVRDPDILVVDQFAADIEQRLCREVFEAVRRDYEVSILYLGHRVPAGLAPDQVYWMEHGGLEPRIPGRTEGTSGVMAQKTKPQSR